MESLNVTVSLDDFKTLILPNFDHIVFDDRLRPVQSNYDCCESKEFDGFHVKKKDVNTSSVIVNVGHVAPHYVAFVSCDRNNVVYAFDSCLSSGHDLTPWYEHIFKSKHESGCTLIRVDCPQQRTDISICHAYLNALLTLWAISQDSQTRGALDRFIEELKVDPFLSEQNACKVAAYILTAETECEEEALCNDELYMHRQKLVDDQIATCVSRCENLDNTIKGLRKTYSSINSREKLYINRKYIECCIQTFNSEVENQLKTNVAEICKDPGVIISYTEGISSLTDLEKYFGTLKHYHVLTECKMNKTQLSDFLQDVKTLCWRHVFSKMKFIQAEKVFRGALEQYLRLCFLKGSEIFGGDIDTRSDKKALFASVISHLRNTTDKDCSTLKSIAVKVNYFEECSPLLIESLKTVFDDYLSVHQLKSFNKDRNHYLECTGRYLDLEKVVHDILSHRDIKVCDEVHIFAHKMLRVNCSLELNGKNLVVITPEMYLCTEALWDVSGKDGEKVSTKKAENGTPGLFGKNGGSGGNVVIRAHKLVKKEGSERLIIHSHGGNGSEGQDGGKGKDGKDGEDGIGMSMDDFKKKFPECSITVVKGNAHSVAKATNLSNMQPYTLVCDDSCAKYYEGEIQQEGANESNTVLFSVKNNPPHAALAFLWLTPWAAAAYFAPYRQAYCIVKGTNGTNGTSGGDGGKGGVGGRGGLAGTLSAVLPRTEMSLPVQFENIDGSDGHEGKDGSGGKGGRNGTRGMDVGKVEPSQLRDTRYFQGSLKLEYSSSSSSENAWCPKAQKYAEIKKVLNPSGVTYNRHGEVGANKSSQQQEKRRSRLRNTPISMAEVQHQFNISRKTDLYEDLHMDRHKLEMMAGLEVTLSVSAEKKKQQETTMHRILRPAEDELQSKVCMPVYIPQVQDEVNQKDDDTVIFNEAVDGLEVEEGGRVKTESRHGYKYMIDEQLSKLNTISKSVSRVSLDFDKIGDLVSDLAKMKLLYPHPFWQLFGRRSLSRPITSSWSLMKASAEMKRIIGHIEKTLVQKYRFAILQHIREFSENLVRKTFRNKEPRNAENDSKLEHLEQALQLIISDTCILITEEIDELTDLSKMEEYTRLKKIEIERTVSQTSLLDDDAKMPLFSTDAIEIDGGDNEEKTTLDALVDDENYDPQEDAKDVTKPDETDLAVKYADIDEDESTIDTIVSTSEDNHEGVMGITAIYSLKQKLNAIVQDLPKDVQELLSKLGYIQAEHVELLARVLSTRLRLEDLQIPQRVFKWLIMCITEEYDTYGIDDYLMIFATSPQSTWLLEYFVLQLRGEICLSYYDQLELRKKLLPFKSHALLPLFSQQLNSRDADDMLTIDNIVTIFQLSKNMKIDDELCFYLQNFDISEWLERFQWFKMLIALKQINTDEDWQDNTLVEAVYYASQLASTYGQSRADLLLGAISPDDASSVALSCILLMLQNFGNNHWTLNDNALSIIKNNCCGKWAKLLDDMFLTDAVRPVKELTSLMASDYHNSDCIISGLAEMENIVLDTIPEIPLFSAIINDTDGKGIQEKQIRQWSTSDITHWTQRVRYESKTNQNFIRENIAELITVVDQAISIKKGFTMRDTQKLSIVVFLSNDGMLQQIATGEGKTLIIVVLGVIKALCGERVDVITSSSVLARRDAKINRDLYSVFGVTVGHNCSDSEEERKTAYTRCDIVYGDIGSFQRDILLDGFYNKGIGIDSRRKGSVMVDEVDSMLLDKLQHVLYLSHDIPGMDTLEDVYVNIWNFVHGKGMVGTDDDIKEIHECMLSAMYCRLRKEDIRRILGVQDRKREDEVWNYLVEKRIIEENGTIQELDRVLKNETNLLDISGIEMTTKDTISCRLKDIVRQGVIIQLPTYLKEFVHLHLDGWIENAFRARWMVLNDNYVIDIDRTEESYEITPNIIIIEKETGVEQYHAQWSNGLHQFLQLKHGCRLSNESLKAVFISNVSFFTRYHGKLYGLTGTLGTKQERDMLKDIYEVEYATIPSFRPSKFLEKAAKKCTTENDWTSEITKVAYSTCQVEGRPILIVCDSVDEVDRLDKSFEEKETEIERNINIHVYKRSFKPLKVGDDDPIDQPCIIIATNLAGRGTDIKITDAIDELGGLHVCLAYLPTSCRVDEQAFGRAARKGQKGSGQMIYHSVGSSDDHNFVSRVDVVIEDKLKRDQVEERRITDIQKHYHSTIRREEEMFATFRKTYHSLKSKMEKRKQPKEQREIILQNCLDEWAFWLDKTSILAEPNPTSLEDFLSRMSKAGDGELCLDFMRIPAQRTKMAKECVDRKEFQMAEEIYNKIITEDETFSEAAYYYKCQCIVKRGGLKDKKDIDDFYYHLYRADDLVKQKVEKLASFSSMVDMIGKFYETQRESFLQANDYPKQKEDQIQLYTAISSSVPDMVGHEITVNALETCLSNPMLQSHAFDILMKEGILTKAHVSPLLKSSSRQWKTLRDKYQLSFNEIENVINKQKAGDVSENTFKNILPSREEFWKEMVNAGLLINERVYVILDLKQLDDAFMVKDSLLTYKDQLCHMEGCNDFNDLASRTSNPCANETKADLPTTCKSVCLHPQQIDDINNKKLKAIPMETFKNKIGHLEIFQALKQKCILVVNKLGDINPDMNARMNKFDSLNKDAFTAIYGVKSNMSEDIFCSLQKNKIVSADKSEAMLLIDSITADSVGLTCYPRYEGEILNFLTKHFRYRIAFNDLVREGNITLESKPHKNLYGDLVSLHIVEPVRVKAKLEDCEVENKVEIFGKTLFTIKNIFGNFSRLQLKEICKIDRDIDVGELWKHLIEKKWTTCVDPDQLYKCLLARGWKVVETASTKVISQNWSLPEAVISFEEDCENCALDEKYRSVEDAVKIHLLCSKEVMKKTTDIITQLQSWRSAIFKYKHADARLIDLEDRFDMETLAKMPEELAALHSNGLNHIITLAEAKWTWAIIFRICAIIVIGIVQIVLGALIEVFSAGIGTNIASGLIGEGLGDIMFAIECCFSGYCTWQAYAQHKVMSVCITVLTAGVGAFFSRGAQFSRYGYKIGEKFIKSVGMDLVEEVGKRRIMKEVGKRVIKECTKAGALGLANVGIDKAIKSLLDSALESISNGIIQTFQNVGENKKIKEVIQELCQKVGPKRAEEIIKKMNDELYGEASKWHEILNHVFSVLSTFGSAVADGIAQASEKLEHCGNGRSQILTTVSKVISKVLEHGQQVKVIAEIVGFNTEFTSCLENKLVEINMNTSTIRDLSHEEHEADKLCRKMAVEWNEYLTRAVKEKISSELLKPIGQKMANKLIGKVGIQMKNGYSQLRTSHQSRKLARLRTQRQQHLEKHGDSGHDSQIHKDFNDMYFTKLIALEKKVKDPGLLADIMREGGPVGIHGIQAIAEYLQRPIKINTIGGDDTMTIPKEFNPGGTTVAEGEPLVLDFHVGEKGSYGHFTNPQSQPKVNDPLKYDCLFDAVSSQTHEPVTRDHIASIVETNPLITSRIKQGIHDHFIGKGAIGGAHPSKKNLDRLKAEAAKAKKFSTAKAVNKAVEKIRKWTRDRAKKLIVKQKGTRLPSSGTGSDEILQTSLVFQWATMPNTKGVPYTHFDAHCHVRVDTRYVLWKHKDNTTQEITLQGHSGCLRQKNNNEITYRTAGQADFHKHRTEDILKHGRADHAVAAGLASHMSQTIHPDDLKKMPKLENCWSSTGHDLSKPNDRQLFTKAYEREYYKNALVAEKFGVPLSPTTSIPPNLKHDQYLIQIKAQIDTLAPHQIEQLGNILRTPAPI